MLGTRQAPAGPCSYTGSLPRTAAGRGVRMAGTAAASLPIGTAAVADRRYGAALRRWAAVEAAMKESAAATAMSATVAAVVAMASAPAAMAAATMLTAAMASTTSATAVAEEAADTIAAAAISLALSFRRCVRSCRICLGLSFCSGGLVIVGRNCLASSCGHWFDY